jgi:hypothetical protein
MKDSNLTNSQNSAHSAAPQDMGFSPWQRLKSKRISYLTLPLIVMATVVEFVILATGLKYQQVVCVPQGMGVIFFGIGPIGATILAVELLKLPLAIWTASRVGWQKGFMLIVGLPLICVLTFQLVKDMAVYEMGTAMTPASQMLEKAAVEEIKIAQLNAELENQTKDDSAVKAVIQEKKVDRDRKLAELAAKQTKAKAELEESLKRNDATRQDAITLTDYQKKELSEAEARQATIIRQFDADAAQLTKAIADLRTRRETEVARATTWNVEEARIENAYKAKLADYTNKKRAYDKDKAEYDSANFLRRKLMSEPVHPGVPPERESNKILKPTLVAEIEAQIKAKEAELITVNTKRRDRVAQVDTDARRLREDFDRRSGTKREETDRKREELLAAMALLVKEGAAEAKLIDQEFTAAARKQEDALKNQRPLDQIRAELDGSRKTANGYYEAREAAIKKTQVHRIATTVEIVRGWLFGERPVSITATAKERGDLLTDQISMVRIWVYPVLAFIVAFLPTLMVEIGFSTLFKPEQHRPPHRLGFFGRGLHWLYIRAGRRKILRAERMAREASIQITLRDKALTAANAAAAAHEEQLKKKQDEWDAKFAGLTDSLKHALVEKDALRDLQQMEIERQVQLRQNAWSDRLAQMGQEIQAQHAANEAERTAMVQEHQKKLTEVSEDCRTQVMQARRQMADAELAAEEALAKLAYESKDTLNARDEVCSQLQLQVESLSLKLTQAKEETARETEKAARQEKHRLERQQLELDKTLRQRNEELEHQLKRREQELSLEFDTRFAQEQARVEQAARDREEKFERQLEARAREVDARWNQELQQREEAAQIRLKQREQQLQAQAEVRFRDMQTQAEEQLRRRESEWKRQLDSQLHEAETRLSEELQQKELAFHARLKQREQELIIGADARETELQNQRALDLRARGEEWERQAESRVRAIETRLSHEAQQKEELFKSKLGQRDQQWEVKLATVQAELQAQNEELLRRREMEAEAALRKLEAQLRKEMQQKEDAVQVKARQRELELVTQLTVQAEVQQMAAQQQWEAESDKKTRAVIEPLKELLARTEKERDAAVSHVQALESKLTEATLFLNGWKNRKQTDEAA